MSPFALLSAKKKKQLHGKNFINKVEVLYKNLSSSSVIASLAAVFSFNTALLPSAPFPTQPPTPAKKSFWRAARCLAPTKLIFCFQSKMLTLSPKNICHFRGRICTGKYILHKKGKHVQCILTNANVKKFRTTSARFILERETRKKRQKKKKCAL